MKLRRKCDLIDKKFNHNDLVDSFIVANNEMN